jgi:hypothetical protein
MPEEKKSVELSQNHYQPDETRGINLDPPKT